MGKKNVSLRVIASELGVSINTVSHALRDMKDISDETKQRVRKKALELGYMPNVVSQRLKGGERAVIAILVSSFSNLYFSPLCNELIKKCQEGNAFDVQIIYFNGDHMDVLKQCILQRVDLIVTHARFPEDAFAYARLNNIKIILLGDEGGQTETDIVAIDEPMGCSQAARYLWSMHKCKKYLYVGIDCVLSELRYSLFSQELRELGAKDIERVSYDNNNAAKLFEFIKSGYRNIFFYNDETAYKALYELDLIAVDIRKRFPDLHIVGFDGLCEVITGLTQITTIKIDYAAYASAIYDTIVFRFDNSSLDFKKVIVPTSLHQRKKY